VDNKIYCVYMHTAPNGKVYIGITSQSPKQRFRKGGGYWHNEHFLRAINLYGWENIKHEILETGLARCQAISEEKRLIAEYDSTNYEKGYNMMTGGDGLGTHTQETIEYLRKINIGKYWTDEQKEAKRQKMLGHTLSKESRAKLSVSKTGNRKGIPLSEEHKKKIRENSPSKKGVLSNLAKTVIKYDLSSNYICEYPAISTAAEENNIPNPYNISACCRGKLKTAYGFIWRYADEPQQSIS